MLRRKLMIYEVGGAKRTIDATPGTVILSYDGELSALPEDNQLAIDRDTIVDAYRFLEYLLDEEEDRNAQ